MNKIIDRRSPNLSELRNKMLENYFSDKNSFNEDVFSLDLTMFRGMNSLRNDLYKAIFKSKYDSKVILHKQQVEVLKYLKEEKYVLLSAPTSFGKTFVALEYIKRAKPKMVVFVVPTLALMQEIFVKCLKKFDNNVDKYHILRNSYEKLGPDNNIIIIVPERVNNELLSKIDDIDLMIFDEIYKLSKGDDEQKNDKRIIQMNKGYFQLVNKAKKVLLLGPFIKDVEFEQTKLKDGMTKFFSDYSPVYIKCEKINEGKDEFISKKLLNTNNGLMVYFKTPNDIYNFSRKYILSIEPFDDNALIRWCKKYISSEWTPVKMLERGIGVHHGHLPMFMRTYIENLYNDRKLPSVLCTSTLLEGVNTPTFNLIVYDDDMTPFRFNNLIGRVGRLGEDMPGNVWFFNEKYQDYLIGDAKYKPIKIVAEDTIASTVEEVLYMDKKIESLPKDKIAQLEQLLKCLKKYNKNLNDLKEIDNLHLSEFIMLLNSIDYINESLFEIQKINESSDPTDKKKSVKYKEKIIKKLLEIIPTTEYFLKSYNSKKNLSKNDRRSEASVINRLLYIKPRLYTKINSLICDFPDKNELNGFIDYLFYLSNNYIRYEMSRFVSYFRFLFKENHFDFYYDVLDKIILNGIIQFNLEDDKISSILYEIGIPPTDIKNVKKILDISDEEPTMSNVINSIKKNINKIISSKKIDEMTKELMQVYS